MKGTAYNPRVGLRGPNQGLDLSVTNKTLLLLALLAVTYLRRPKSHLKQYGGVLEPGFHTPRELFDVKNPIKLIADNITDFCTHRHW